MTMKTGVAERIVRTLLFGWAGRVGGVKRTFAASRQPLPTDAYAPPRRGILKCVSNF
jgi:hypothetical protein